MEQPMLDPVYLSQLNPTQCFSPIPKTFLSSNKYFYKNQQFTYNYILGLQPSSS